ncbi:MAG TPA: hypothetical protein PLB25_14270 [Rhodoferax sp.]|nr:hypothetical protein [Rhodoferax sp.]
MSDMVWSATEKKVARRVFDAALQRELADIMADFKTRAAQASTPDDLWAIKAHLVRVQHDIDSKYDYRYSTLEFVLGRLLFEQRVQLQDLTGMKAERIAKICRIASQ